MSNFTEFRDQLRKAQKSIPTVRQKLAQLRVTREAGAGLVKATLDGHKYLVKVEIDPSIINPSDREMLQDLIVAANNLAIHDVEHKVTDIIISTAPDMPKHFPPDVRS